MGLTNKSVGHGAIDTEFRTLKRNVNEKLIAIAGNPNVGKSTIFNALTGMNQHTGNWSGKTVSNAFGYIKTEKFNYTLVDIPGTYSLFARSVEEEVARNFICFKEHDAIVVVCDATCLERNLNLVLQILEVSPKTIVCVNLLDEAKRKGININIKDLSSALGVPVVGTVAQKPKTLNTLKRKLDDCIDKEPKKQLNVTYPNCLEEAIKIVKTALDARLNVSINTRWLALNLLDYDESLINEINYYCGRDLLLDEEIVLAINKGLNFLESQNVAKENIKDLIAQALFSEAERISQAVTTVNENKERYLDQKIDKVLTGKRFGYPIMILLVAIMFWITVSAANFPSSILSKIFEKAGVYLCEFLILLKTPPWLFSMLTDGVYKVLSWVVAVMLPPMAIFFPLFTLLEDVGYLPRIAYNLDKPFKQCKTCGKQALTMCMGLGCNAAGVVGCRIIDSPRERLVAILTNSFIPCNGRFPTLISLITILFAASSMGIVNSIVSALLLTCVIVLGVVGTLICSKILSNTILKGVPSSFILELPPYRKPQIGKIIVRSIFDRTIFVLGRAIAIAAPAGILIWIFANVNLGEFSILAYCSNFLEPLGRSIGLDGVILMAFILGFPANEIVLPLIIMGYLSQGTISEISSIADMKAIFMQNGWSSVTVICTIIFTLFHWPCSTTVLTIKKETGSIKWTAVAIALPTVIGITLCFLVATIAKII